MISRPIYREWSGPSPAVDKLWRLDVPARSERTGHRVLPDGCMDLVARLSRTPSGTLEWVDLLIAGASPSANLVGVCPGNVFLGVRFRPAWGGRSLGVDPQALTGQVVKASAVSRRYAALEAELTSIVAPGHLRQAFRAILHRTTQTVAPAGRAQVAVDLIQASHGGIDLRRLARELSVSPRTLRREVVAQAGLPPKVLARVFRFRYALTCPSPSLAGLAAAAGYADQAHMTREFAALAGFSPARWMAEIFKTHEAKAPIIRAGQEIRA